MRKAPRKGGAFNWLAKLKGWYSRATMSRITPYLLLAPVLALAAGVSLLAQGDPNAQPQTVPEAPHERIKIVPAPSDVDDLPPGKIKSLPGPVLTPPKSPFAIEGGRKSSANSIRILSEAEMSATDRDLVADAQSSIQEHAGFQNLDFSGNGWTYHQLDCPALPNHLFLRFTRNEDTREMSMFSAAIPRNGDGRVHIIPIVRRGYSLFSPAPVGALTIAAFNRIRTEEGADESADWLGTGLCYAALAGANPQLGKAEAVTSEKGDAAATIPPTLVVKSDGSAAIRFADVSSPQHPMEWNMVFDTKGKLVKATHAPASVPRFKKDPGTPEVGAAARRVPER